MRFNLVLRFEQICPCCFNSTEAKPYYPLSLRTVFDTAPIKFTVADTSPSKNYMDHIRKLTSSQQTGYCSIWMSSMFNLEKNLELAKEHAGTTIPVYCSLPLSSEKLLSNDSVPQLSTRCACYERQLRQVGTSYLFYVFACPKLCNVHFLGNHLVCSNFVYFLNCIC